MCFTRSDYRDTDHPGTGRPGFSVTQAQRGAVNGLPEQASDLSLRFDEPARQWVEALPVGNGSMGAMVFGGIEEERIQFNEDTLWLGEPHDYSHEGAAGYLDEIRRLLFSGEQQAAEQLALREFMSEPLRQMSYQPFADLDLRFDHQGEISEYQRSLDLDTATATVSYRMSSRAIPTGSSSSGSPVSVPVRSRSRSDSILPIRKQIPRNTTLRPCA